MELAIQIEFLVTPQLSDPASPKYGEWPPAPDRVFQAMVATAAETGKELSVLHHLESAPKLQASNALKSKSPLRYVPENFRRSKGYHKGTERYLPTVIPEAPAVTYIWEDVPNAAVPEIKEVVESITHIGRATSLVRGALVEPSSVKVNWLPDKNGQLRLRTPYPGRLHDLQEAYVAGVRSSPAPTVSYKNTEHTHPTTGWSDLMVLRPERQLDITKATHWTDSLRRAVMSNLGDEVPSLIHGHGEHRHVAWAAIPDIGHKYASGGIIGLGCWLPADISLEERGIVGAALLRVSKLQGMPLELDSIGLKGLQAGTWAKPSRTWATATPLALDRWPKRNKPPEEVLRRSIHEMGLPDPTRIVCSNHSPVKGTVDSRGYPARHGNRYITHAVIEWPRPILGPLLIGADRYYGSGLCRPWRGGN